MNQFEQPRVARLVLRREAEVALVLRGAGQARGREVEAPRAEAAGIERDLRLLAVLAQVALGLFAFGDVVPDRAAVHDAPRGVALRRRVQAHVEAAAILPQQLKFGIAHDAGGEKSLSQAVALGVPVGRVELGERLAEAINIIAARYSVNGRSSPSAGSSNHRASVAAATASSAAR